MRKSPCGCVRGGEEGVVVVGHFYVPLRSIASACSSGSNERLVRPACLHPTVAQVGEPGQSGVIRGFDLAQTSISSSTGVNGAALPSVDGHRRQQITVAAAARLAGRMVAAHGEPLSSASGPLTHVFPRPDVVGAAGLASLGMPRSRAAALSAVAAAAVADPHLFDSNCGLDDAVKRLCAIRGVGEWTAQYIALRQLPDAFPAADLGLLRAVAGREAGKTCRRNSSIAPMRGARGGPMPHNICGRQRRAQAFWNSPRPRGANAARTGNKLTALHILQRAGTIESDNG